MEKIGAIHSPFRYAGGKFYARKLILEHFPSHDSYIEPFAGGASIFFCKGMAPKLNWLNDIDGELTNTLLTIRDYPNNLIEELKYTEGKFPLGIINNLKCGEPIPADKKLHGYMKNSYRPKTDIERAFRWYYLNRTSYSGIMNFRNMYWGYGDKFSMQPKNWPRAILSASEKLQGVKITSLDFEDVIKNAPDNALLYLDPPYYNADQDKFYEHYFSKEDHYRLAKCLFENRNRLKLFISYDNTPDIVELYSWAKEIHTAEWNYCIQRTDDQKEKTNEKGHRYKGKELFILDF